HFYFNHMNCLLKKICFVSLVCLIIHPFSFAGEKTDSNIITPRMRVIVDNDFGGDPDGLFQLAHILLSPSVDVRAIIGSHLNAADGFDRSKTQAENAAKKASELLQIMGIKSRIPIIAGSNTAMQNDSKPVKSEAVNFII